MMEHIAWLFMVADLPRLPHFAGDSHILVSSVSLAYEKSYQISRISLQFQLTVHSVAEINQKEEAKTTQVIYEKVILWMIHLNS